NSGTATFNGAIGNVNPLSFLLVNGASTINGGIINTVGSGGQTFNGLVTLGNNTALTGGNAGPLNINAGLSGPTFSFSATQFTNIFAPATNGGVVTQSLTLGGGSGTLFGTINGQPGAGSIPFITLLFGSGPFTFNGIPLNQAPPPINQNTVPSTVSTNSWLTQQDQYYDDYLNGFDSMLGMGNIFGNLDSLIHTLSLPICVQSGGHKNGEQCIKSAGEEKKAQQ
ncbi:MAG: hypothetical protein JSS53_01035, partial [Proteobacteria bacterium]|nr:hypothetical protein [Pseudomonadota bacterium]